MAHLTSLCGKAAIFHSVINAASLGRSPYFAIAYAANDVVLIVLWILASVENIRYISVVVCFAAFFANDIYGYISWHRMKKRQAENR